MTVKLKTIMTITLLISILGLYSCASNPEQKTKNEHVLTKDVPVFIDKQKRDELVKKYNLVNFVDNKKPIFLSLTEFFDRNNDDASIAPNLDFKPNMSEYYNTLKQISNDPKIITAFVELKDAMIYKNNQLDDNEWFYTDIVYFVGDLTLEDIKTRTENLKPDEVEYLEDELIRQMNPEFVGKKVVYLWWD